MENSSFQTSFIPKKPITSDVTVKEPRNFFSIITTLLLVISILISGGLFLYKLYLTKQQNALSASLLVTRDSFEKDTIDELELFNQRTESAKQILSNHVVLSPMFTLLGEITIPQVQYTNFKQQTDAKGFLVSIQGLARDYKSIALQADVFNSAKGRSFTNVLFSNLVKDKNNNVSFDLKFNISPDLLSYEKNILLEQIKKPNNIVTPQAPVLPQTAPVVTPQAPVVPQTAPVVTPQTPTTPQIPPITPPTPLVPASNPTQ